MIFDKVKAIIVDQLGVEENEVKLESSFVDDVGADSLDAVSYTHLDVYKRQVLQGVWNIGKKYKYLTLLIYKR